jgi:hypothetical protein
MEQNHFMRDCIFFREGRSPQTAETIYKGDGSRKYKKQQRLPVKKDLQFKLKKLHYLPKERRF